MICFFEIKHLALIIWIFSSKWIEVSHIYFVLLLWNKTHNYKSQKERVILVKKAQEAFLDGFGIFWKKNIFWFQFFLLKSFILSCFSKCNIYFQSVLISCVLISENITKMSHVQQCFYWNSTFPSWILLKLHCLHN